MNTRNIEPIEIWTESGKKSVSVLALSNFYDYHFDDGSGKVEYKLISVDPEHGANEHFIGIIEIPSEIIQQWGQSDDIIFNYVLEKLQLTIINQ